MPQVTAATGIERHWDEVAAFLTRRLGDPAAAADLTQETYLRAATLPANTALLNPRAWLFATARNLLVDHARRARVRHAVNADGGDMELCADRQPRADAVLLLREELVVLERAVDALPPRTREVFRLHKFEGASYDEIAARLGIAKNTVMVHMVKALGQLRQTMRDHRAGEILANGSQPVARLPGHGF